MERIVFRKVWLFLVVFLVVHESEVGGVGFYGAEGGDGFRVNVTLFIDFISDQFKNIPDPGEAARNGGEG